MIGKQNRWQGTLFMTGSLEELIPTDHILKKVDKVLDLSWLHAEVSDCYCDSNGRPGIDPESAVRLMLAGFFQGIVHDRKLIREAQVNLAIRWFAGYRLDEKLPDHSSLTRIRQRWGADRFKKVFQKTVEACIRANLVNGETVHVDSTLIRADVSWESLTTEHANKVLEENSDSGISDNPIEEEVQKKRGRPRTRPRYPKKHSTTDPEATLATSSKNRKLEPSYKQHTTVDDKAGVVVDIELTTGEINEGTKLIEGIERLEVLTGKKVERITADASYAHPKNYAAMEERRTDAIIPPMPEMTTLRSIPIRRFSYDGKHKTVRCPTGKFMKCMSREKNGWLYRAKIRDCKACHLRKNCLPPTGKVRTVCIVDGYEALLRARRRKSRWDEERHWYNRHRWRVEGVHGEAKTQHGLRRAVRRGLMNVAIQVYLTAAVMNLKRLAAALLPYFWIIINRLLLLKEDFKKRGTIIKSFWNYDGEEAFNIVMAV
jgi:transposase